MKLRPIAVPILAWLVLGFSNASFADEQRLEDVLKARQQGHVVFSASVNFFDTRLFTLFVQDGEEAVYVRLPENAYVDPPELRAGTKVRISGEFDSKAFVVLAEELTVLEHSAPLPAMILDLKKLTLGDHWSRRVQVGGVVESLLVEDVVVQMVLRTEDRRILLRRRGGLAGFSHTAFDLIGARIDVEGTLAYLTDDEGRPTGIICHQMNGDPLQVVSHPEPKLTGRETELMGKLGLVTPTGFATLETDGGDAISFYAPFYADLQDGDGVTIRAVPHDGKRIIDLPELTDGSDCLGEECDYVVRVLERQHVASLVATTTVVSIDSDESDLENQRVTVSGRLKEVSSNGQQHQLTLIADGEPIQIELTATQEQIEELQQGADRLISITGVARFGGDGLTIITSDLGAVRVLGPKEGLSRQTVMTATLVFSLLLAGFCGSLWMLRRQAGKNQRALQDVVARLNSSYEAVREGILVVDSHGCVVGGNDRFYSTFGLTSEELQTASDSDGGVSCRVGELVGQKFAKPGEFVEFWQRASRNALNQMSEEMNLAGSDETAVIVYTTPIVSAELRGQSAGRIWTFDDVSERKRLEKNLLQSQKLEAVGRLAGGVAHDFNNLLMAMTANLEIVKANPDQTVREAEKYIGSVEMSATRAAELIRRLLGFSRKTELKMEVTDPNQVVQVTQELLERTIGVETTVAVRLEVEDTYVNADAIQLQQVLLNVCLNAHDALPEGRGTIEISTSVMKDGGGEFLCIAVTDDGAGMTDETRARIYEPFFTTKGPEHGTGLGLAMSFGIIEQHGGRLECDSAVDVGSTFRILLPIASNEQPSQSFVVNDSLPNDRVHVLIADDGRAVLDSISAALKQNGFRVTEASDGEEAIKAFINSGTIDIVLLDLSMPGLTGLEALAEIKRISPDTPGIIMTGYLDTVSDIPGDLIADEIIEKPVSIDQLAFVLRSACRKAERQTGAQTA